MGIVMKKWSPREFLNKTIGGFVHWIDLNAVSLTRDVVLKRRNAFGRRITPAANWFFRACRAPIRFWNEVKGWQQWEVKCFRMLHPRNQAIAVGPDAVCQDRLPGKSYWELMHERQLTVAMLEAAAREMRRGHDIWSEEYQGGWSHGDAAMGNLLYDAQSGRALFIDFEVMHDRELSEVQRHADDLHAFLMDLVGYVPRRKWLPFSLAFLRAYDKPEVLAELRKKLEVPKGSAWIWWKIRGNFVREGKMARRFAKLGRQIDQGALEAVSD